MSDNTLVSDDEHIIPDLFNMKAVAQKVNWGAPSCESSDKSSSSGGANVYGRGAGKNISAEKKRKSLNVKKRSKESSKRTKTDLLDKNRGTQNPKQKKSKHVVRKRK